MRKQRRVSSGFTLIELMIVVVIIGILAAMAIPRFMKTTTRTKQAEAMAILKQIYVSEHAYRQQSATMSYYTPPGPASAATPQALRSLWIDIMPSARYTYTVVAGPTTFTATAQANIDDDATLDTWTIDQDGLIQNTINDVQT